MTQNKSDLISESFSIQLQSPKKKVPNHYTQHYPAKEKMHRAPFFGYWSKSEKLSEIKPPLIDNIFVVKQNQDFEVKNNFTPKCTACLAPLTQITFGFGARTTRLRPLFHLEKFIVVVQGAVFKRRRNFFGRFFFPPPPCWNFNPDLPNPYLLISCNIEI